MTSNIETARTLLNAYYTEKNIELKRDKKLDRFLKAGKWKKYQKRCKKIYTDYNEVIQKIADEYVKDVRQKIADNEEMSASALSLCENNVADIKNKINTSNTSIADTQTVLSSSRSKAKKANTKIESIAKIARDIELKRPQGDGDFTNLAKALGKTNSLNKKAKKSLGIIDINITNIQQQQATLNTRKKEAKKLSLQLEELHKNIKTSQTQIIPFKKELEKIKTLAKEEILNSGLLEKLNDSAQMQELNAFNEQAKNLNVHLANIDPHFAGADIETVNTNELNNIAEFLTLAKEQWNIIAAKHTTGFHDSNSYYAYYESINTYASPFKAIRKQAAGILQADLNKKYQFIDKKGDFREIENIGWCRYDDFYTQKQKKRFDYLNAYKRWLDAQFNKMLLLKGQEKLDRIKGILSQAEIVIEKFHKKTPLSINALDAKPIFKNNSKNINCPHELIAPLRKWVELTEKPILNITKETDDNENAGSLYSGIDWNTRLKVPQYRTQSDNLISPESTCAPTTFTMMAERAGWSRADIITAIENRFTNQGATDLAKTWETKGKAFFKWINKHGSKNYQKVRAGKIGTIKFNALAKNFKRFGQYEDLTIFYHYLINSAQKTMINSNEKYNDNLRQGLENDGNFGKRGSFVYKMIKGKQLLPLSATRKRIKKHLDQGDVVMFSIYHKGAKSKGTHNYHIQSINHKGFVIDDPFGKQNIKYKRKKGVIFDLYMEEGDAVTRHRKNYAYKNTPDFTGKDYTKEKAQQLIASESRGDTSLLSWKMLNDSDQGIGQGIISYIVIWEKIKH